MKPLLRTFAVGALALSFSCGPVIAQDHHDDQEHHDQDRDSYVRHDDWKRGQQIRHEDWDRGRHVDDWQGQHLRRPQQGYEWRRVDGQYVMADSDGRIYQVVVPHR